MKAKFKSFSLLFAILLVFASCSNPMGDASSGDSIINIDLGSGEVPSRAAKGVSISSLTHSFKFSGPTGVLTRSITGGGTVQVVVVAGTWQIEVQAYLGMELYAVGSAIAMVKAGQTTNVSIQMNVVWSESAGTPRGEGNPDYPITIETGTNGTASASLPFAKVGTTVNINASPDTFYQFKQWVVLEGSITLASGTGTNGNSFVMPSGAVKIRADFESAPAAALSLSGVSFSAISYGDPTPGPQTVTITNTGTEAGVVTNIALSSGSSFTLGSLSPPIPATLAAGGGTATFTIQPTATNAGTYNGTVTVTYTGGGANTTATTGVSFTINKAAATVNWPGTLVGTSYVITTTYSPTATLLLHLPTSNGAGTPGTFAWAAGNGTSVGNAGTTADRSFILDFTPTDTANYMGASLNVYFTVNKAAGAGVSAPTENTKTYNSITINTVTAPTNGQTVEYACSSGTAPATGWQTGLTFDSEYDATPLAASTAYNIYARSASNTNYEAGTPNTVSITTSAHTYTLTLSPTTVAFTAITYGGTQPAAQTINISNSGTGTATVSGITLSGDPTPGSAFTVSPTSIASVTPGSNTASFTVQPKATVDVGSYNETITVTYDGAATVTATVTITVNKAAGATVNKPPDLDEKTATSIKIKDPSPAITLTPPTTGQSLEYACTTSTTAPSTGWVSGTMPYTFSGLTPATQYYIFARAAESANYNAGDPSTTSLQVMTPTSVGFTITFTQIAEAAPTITGPTISRTGSPKTATLTVASPLDYDSIDWFITGTSITGTGATFTLDSANDAYNGVGAHFLTLEVVKSGKPYSKQISFTVTN